MLRALLRRRHPTLSMCYNNLSSRRTKECMIHCSRTRPSKINTSPVTTKCREIHTLLGRTPDTQSHDGSSWLVLFRKKQQPQYQSFRYFEKDNVNHRESIRSTSQRLNLAKKYGLRRRLSNASPLVLLHELKNTFREYRFEKENINNNSDYRSSGSTGFWTSSIRYIQTSTNQPINDNTDDRKGDGEVDHTPPGTTAATTTANDGDETCNISSNHVEVNEGPTNDPVQQPPPPPIEPQPFVVVVRHWLQQLRAIPNMITVSRILLIPFISYWIIQHQTMMAFIGCVYAAISDVLDGFIARRYPSMQTPLGTYLDPLADKLFINALSISLWVNGTLPTTLVGLWLVRDVILMIATHQYVAQNTRPGMTVMDPVTVPIQVIPTTLSKINTGLQFITLAVGIVAVPSAFPIVTDATTLTTIVTSTIETVSPSVMSTPTWYDFDNLFFTQRMYITDHILPPLCWITGATTIGSSLSYYGHSAFISAKHTIPDTDSHKVK